MRPTGPDKTQTGVSNNAMGAENFYWKSTNTE
jgi:hypothetical protein